MNIWDNLYHVVYADPPWHFDSKQVQKYNGTRFHSLDSMEYPTMTIDDICNLPVNTITYSDAALFLWSTDAHIPSAIKVMESWGFKYITIAFIWYKTTSTGKLHATLGAWTMKNCEVCLLGTKGSMLQYKQVNNIYQLVGAEIGRHSAKPEEVRHRIELLFGDIPKVELFAREQHPGWDVWGNEV